MTNDTNQPNPPDERADIAGSDLDASSPPSIPTLEIPGVESPVDDEFQSKHVAVVAVAPGDSTPRQSPRPSLFDVAPSARQIMLPWCMWLLGSWAVSLWMESPAAAIRWMLFSSMFGIMLVWPTFRLSQDGRSNTRRGYQPNGSRAEALELREVRPPRKQLLTPGVLLRDWFSLNLVFQAVVWPLRITAGWEWEQAIWIDVAFASWSLLAGALAAWGCRSRTNVGRATAALIIVLVMFAEPLVLALFALINEQMGATLPDWSMRLSPIETLFTLTAAAGLFEPGAWRFNVIAVAAAAVMAWALTLIAWRFASVKRASASRV